MLRKSVTIRSGLRGLQCTLFLAVSIVVSGAVCGCATLERLPAVTYAQAKQTEILDIPDARFYVSELQTNSRPRDKGEPNAAT